MEAIMDREFTKSVFENLQKFLGDRATRSLLHRMAYGRDWSPRESKAANFPDIVVIPKTTEEMAQIAQVAYTYEIPIVPYSLLYRLFVSIKTEGIVCCLFCIGAA